MFMSNAKRRRFQHLVNVGYSVSQALDILLFDDFFID